MTKFETFADARNSGLFARATREGVTRETVGQYLNLAARFRYSVQPDVEQEIEWLTRALAVDAVWGSQYDSFQMGEGTKKAVHTRLQELGVASSLIY